MVSIGAIASMICLSTASAAQQHGGSMATASGTRGMQYSIGQRFGLQQSRIDQGIASGRLTAAESTRIERNEASIQSERRSDRQADNGGRLTTSQREQLVRAQNRAARKIFQLKHNQDKTPGVGSNTDGHSLRGQLSVQQKHIAQGVKSGELNAKQVGKIDSREAQLEAQMRSDRRADNGGKLTATQRKQLIRDENRTAKKIRELENKPTGGT
jgi:hypothetical protein